MANTIFYQQVPIFSQSGNLKTFTEYFGNFLHVCQSPDNFPCYIGGQCYEKQYIWLCVCMWLCVRQGAKVVGVEISFFITHLLSPFNYLLRTKSGALELSKTQVQWDVSLSCLLFLISCFCLASCFHICGFSHLTSYPQITTCDNKWLSPPSLIGNKCSLIYNQTSCKSLTGLPEKMLLTLASRH